MLTDLTLYPSSYLYPNSKFSTFGFLEDPRKLSNLLPNFEEVVSCKSFIFHKSFEVAAMSDC